MPTAPTQAERSAALARLRAHLADPDSPPPSHADLQVLLNPNAQAVALAAANEELRGELAATRSQVAELEAKVRALASDANSYGAKERECDELRSKLIERQEAMLRPLVDALLLITLTSSRLPEGWFQLTPVERAVWVCEHFDGAAPGHTNEVSPCPDRS